MKIPLIAITMGDPAGIGPEIVAKIFERGEILSYSIPLVVGSAAVLSKAAQDFGLRLHIRRIGRPNEAAPAPGVIDVIDLENVAIVEHRWGKPNADSGKGAVAYISRAAKLAVEGAIDAVVTAPINKEMMNAAGFAFAGHTELLAHLTGAKEFGMLFVGGGLTLILTTIHHALRDVPELITRERVLRTLRLAHSAMRDFGIDRPRIGVAALNPHAGEGGLFGNEEQNELLPAVIEARGLGIDASNPLPADTLFYKARNGQFDIVVAMYHDQGLGPLKMLAFGNAVNVTVGLPIIRTSVDHGTAYDIAGKGCANPASLRDAVRLAARIATVRSRRKRESDS
jgi:4-hydroxythreonine-4-phosphate dehydrogenase